MGEIRYHVMFKDEASGEALGLMLTESPQLGFNRRLVNPYAAKGAQGETTDSDLTEWSVLSFRDWRGGRGQEQLEDKAAFFDAWNLETRIQEQLTLGPLPQNPSGTLPRYEPGDATAYGVGWPGIVKSETYVDTNPINNALTYAQRFRVPAEDFDYQVKSVEVLILKESGVTESIRLSIYSDSNGIPGTELSHKVLAAGDVGTTLDWVEFTLDAVLDVTEGGYYWIVLSASLVLESPCYQWAHAPSNVYHDGYMALKITGGSWDWDRGRRDFTFRVHWEKMALAMSFDAPAGGITCDAVQVYLRKRPVVSAAAELTVKLCEDDGGDPGTVLTSKTISSEIHNIFSWVEVEWTSGEALAGGSTYHIVVEPVEEGDRWWDFALWGGDAAAGYSDGAAHQKIGSGSWSAASEDLYFRVNRDELDGAPTSFARYNDKWYLAAGDTVYEWDETGTEWDVSDAQAGDNVTDLETWGGYLWAARGADCTLRRYNGATWADAGTTYAQLLQGGGGYLHRSDPTEGNTHQLYYTADGSTWSDAIPVGSSDHAITGMAWFRDQLVVATSVRLWGIAAEIAYPLLDWSSQEDSSNGWNMIFWSKTGCLYIPLAYGLYRWNGDTMVAMGPEQGTGLPAERAGKIWAMVGTGNWLFVSVDAGDSGQSSVMAYGGMGGWHELQRAEQVGERVLALGFETVSTPSRLWLGLGNETRYLMLPDYTDNPYQWSGYEFNASGELVTSWMGGELLEVVKDLHEVVVRGEDFADDQVVEVYYEVDRSGRWTTLGRVTSGPRSALPFEASNFPTKTVGSGSTRTTIELGAGAMVEEGDWCRINREVAQVASIVDEDTFMLETALSEPPAAGDIIYPSGPAGREFRLKLVLLTEDKTKTPKVKAVFVRYQNNVLDRFVYALSVRVEDGLRDLVGNPYPHTAADLRVALDEWARRACAFSLYDPDGVAHTVKVTGVGEGGFTRAGKDGQAGRFGSVYSINLVEVA